ncbi:MAG: galactose-1-phosphate uridylyltransferase [Candidatus Omnitrophota bacterium]
MSQLRRDPVTGRWIIVNISNPKKPSQFELKPQVKKGGVCPFCTGNEAMTPPEVDAIRKPHSDPDTPGWSVRIVPNKFPALTMEGNLEKRGVGLYDMSHGLGAHEVVIETPNHNKDMADLSEEEIKDILLKYRSRTIALEKDDRFKYVLIFKNHGEPAGASLEHTHTQIVALPIVPKRVTEELKGAINYFGYRERCVFCDMISQELQDEVRIVAQNDKFISFCPFVSRFPFETWIVPKPHSRDFKAIDDGSLIYMASILKDSLLRIKKVLKDPPYNFIIHTAPVRDGINDEYHWHLEIMPKLTNVAGFEWGSGFYINPTSPEFSAKYLREV